MKIRIFFLAAIFLGLVSLVPSPSYTLAVAGCPQATGIRRIEIQNGSGFLSKTNSAQASNQFSTSGGCLLGNQAAINPPTTITTYGELFSLYYTQSKVADAQKILLSGNYTQSSTTSPINLSGAGPANLYRITGDLLILQN